MGEEHEGRRLKRFFELTTDLFCEIGFDGRFRDVNPAWERVLGHPASEVRGRLWSDLVHPDDQESTRVLGARMLQDPTMVLENRYRCRDGGYRWMQWRAIKVPEDEIYYALARDVTDQREREARLRASEAYKDAIFRSAMDAIVTIDREGRVVDFNPAAERMYGFRAAQIRGKPVVDYLVTPENRERFWLDLARWASTNGAEMLEVRQERVSIRADGSRFPIELTVTRPGTEAALFTGFIRDLTDEQRAEAERQHLQQQLQHAQKMEAVGRLAGGVAHDFNNLLSVILGFTEFAAAALAPGTPAHANLAEVKRAAQRAVTLVGALLAFSRRQVLSPKVLDPNGVVLDLERILRGMAGEQIDLELALEPQLGRVKADPAQLEQVLVNLVMNARDAMTEGGRLRIATANLELDAARIPAGFDARPGPYVAISVEDTGVGMSDAVAAHALEPFFTTKEPGRGTGLGLSVVYGIVSQSGGVLRLRTAPGKGTIVCVYLPRTSEEPAAAAETGAGGPSGGEQHASETVLLVEDEEAVRHLVRKILEQRGYKVLVSRHGGEALEICRNLEVHIDLLLTDAVMPVLSGPELLRRAIKLRPDMKLAVMSGYADRPAVTGVPFIAKPFTPDELDRRIREILDSPA